MLKNKRKKIVSVVKVFEKCFKNYKHLEEVEELHEYAEKIESCLTVEEKIRSIDSMVMKLIDWSRRLDYIIESSKYVLGLANNCNYMRKMIYKNKLKITEDQYCTIFKFERFLFEKLKELKNELNDRAEERIENENWGYGEKRHFKILASRIWKIL